MSLILKGIDLPSKDKSPLVITVWANGIVCSVDSNGGIEETTSAIQIPKGHGRLGDIEKLKEMFAMKNNICKECDSFKKCDNKTYSKSEICEKFIWVPTILEAEE